MSFYLPDSRMLYKSNYADEWLRFEEIVQSSGRRYMRYSVYFIENGYDLTLLRTVEHVGDEVGLIELTGETKVFEWVTG